MSASVGASEFSDPVMITARQLAVILRVSKRQVWRMLSARRVPQPIRIGNVVRWRMAEIEQWVADGCPGQP